MLIPFLSSTFIKDKTEILRYTVEGSDENLITFVSYFKRDAYCCNNDDLYKIFSTIREDRVETNLEDFDYNCSNKPRMTKSLLSYLRNNGNKFLCILLYFLALKLFLETQETSQTENEFLPRLTSIPFSMPQCVLVGISSNSLKQNCI